jgi:hypothetical protein
MTYSELMDSILTARDEMLKHTIEANSVTLNGRKYGKLIEGCPPNMKPTIFGMDVKADYAMPDDYDFLVQYEPPHQQTNADRIRAMTDEELAKAMLDCFAAFYDVEWSKQDILNWLKQEAKDA